MKNWADFLKAFLNHLKAKETQQKKGKTTQHAWPSFVSNVEHLDGDGSGRTYQRIFLKGAPAATVLWVQQSLEVAQLFLKHQAFLKKLSIPVPEVFASLGTHFFIQDLGDETLLHVLGKTKKFSQEQMLYQKGLVTLLDLHEKATAARVQAEPWLPEAFHSEFFICEIEKTLEYFFKKHRKKNLSEKVFLEIRKHFMRLLKEIENTPQVYTHRDFHSRNIMIQNEVFFLIDFQDARWGPVTYDLASFLKDSYYQLEESVQAKLLRFYWENSFLKNQFSFELFQKSFDFMSVQRNFKAIGNFAFFEKKRQDFRYLQYIGNTFENIRRTLMKYPDFNALKEVLCYFYYF